MTEPAPGFLLIDDHALFRAGLAGLLAQAWPSARVWQAASGAQGLGCVSAQTPDLIVLDQVLPDGAGLTLLPMIRARCPACPVVVVSSEVDLTVRQAARAAGAAAVLPKSTPPADMLAALRAVLAGEVPGSAETPYPPSVPAQAWVVQEAPAATGDGLAARQGEILRLLGRGTPNKAIARRLGMSEMAVRAEVSWLTERLGARSREEAHALAVARGWLAGPTP